MHAGQFVAPFALESVQGAALAIPPPTGYVHLQFRRFAGCPICNLHLQSFLRRHSELAAHGIQEIAIFHSSSAAMLEHQINAPFPFVADPDKKLYRQFGVETSAMSVLNPKAWPSAIMGLLTQGPGLPSRGESALGLPADVLIDSAGKIVAIKYGRHADDQWALDELLTLAASAQPGSPDSPSITTRASGAATGARQP